VSRGREAYREQADRTPNVRISSVQSQTKVQQPHSGMFQNDLLHGKAAGLLTTVVTSNSDLSGPSHPVGLKEELPPL
jgi:hypothetical protein